MDEKRRHSVLLVNRKTLTLEGVQHVDNFDDDTIVLNTDMGTLTIRGHNLRIQQLDLAAGQFTAEGEIDGLFYSRKRPAGMSADSGWRKLWR